jgi:hypothetical protein
VWVLFHLIQVIPMPCSYYCIWGSIHNFHLLLTTLVGCWEGCPKAVYKAYPVKLTSKPDIEMATRVCCFHYYVIIKKKIPDHNGSMIRSFIYNGMVYKVNRSQLIQKGFMATQSVEGSSKSGPRRSIAGTLLLPFFFF